MSIDRRDSGNYRIRKMIDGKSYSFTLDHKPTKREVEELIREAVSQDAQNVQNGTFLEYGNKYIDIKRNVLSPSTVRSYGFILNGIPDSFLNMQLKKIKSEDIQSAINEYSATHQPKTVRNMSGFISAVFEMFRPNMNYSITLPQKIYKEHYIPTQEEVRKILDYSKGKSYEIMFRLGCFGLRRSEASALKFSDLEPDNTLHINKAIVQDENGDWVIKTTKTYLSTRDIIIPNELAELIRSQPHESEDEFIYKYKPYQIKKALYRCQKELGIQQFRLHDLRHFFVTELSEANVPEEDIMYLGGYSSDYVMKRVYRHARIEKDKEAKRNASYIINSVIN